MDRRDTVRRRWASAAPIVAALAIAVAALGCATGGANARSPVAASPTAVALRPSVRQSPTTQQQILPAEDQLPAVTFYTQSGETPQLHVVIEDDEAKREYGLMYVPSMPQDEGALFMWDSDTTDGFWMENTEIPLTVAWIDANGIIVDMADMQPETLDVHYPSKPYRYAIEANQGWFAQNGVQIGDYVDLTVAYAASPVFGGATATPAPEQ